MAEPFSVAGAGSVAPAAIALAPMTGGLSLAAIPAAGFLGGGGSERQSFPLGGEHLMAQMQRAGAAGGRLDELSQSLLKGQLPFDISRDLERVRTMGREQVMQNLPLQQKAAFEPLAAMGFLRGPMFAQQARKVAQDFGAALTSFDIDQINQLVQQKLAAFQAGIGIQSQLAGQLGQAAQMAQPTTTFRPTSGQQFLQAALPIAGFLGEREMRRQDIEQLGGLLNPSSRRPGPGQFMDQFGEISSFTR